MDSKQQQKCRFFKISKKILIFFNTMSIFFKAGTHAPLIQVVIN